MTVTRNIAGLVGVLVGACLAAAYGAERAPTALEAARVQFAAAVAARDVKRIVALSDFPIAIEMTGAPPKMTAAEFVAGKQNFDNLFGSPDAGIVQCIRTAAPERQDDRKSFGYDFWLIDCNGNDYFFAERHGRWLFVGYENINE